MKCQVISAEKLLVDALKKHPDLDHFEFTASSKFNPGFDVYIADNAVHSNHAMVYVPPIKLQTVVDDLLKVFQRKKAEIILGSLQLNTVMRTLSYDGKIVNLTDIETKIMAEIMQVGGSCSKAHIKTTALNYKQDANTKTVDNHMHNLKQKLADISDFTLESSDGQINLIKAFKPNA